jgi:hypothetical protein
VRLKVSDAGSTKMWRESRVEPFSAGGSLDWTLLNRKIHMGHGMLGGLILVVALGSGCRPGQDEAQDKHPRTERERDSVIGASRLPGATGVRRAMAEQDSAAARNGRLDSVANQP